MSPQKWRQLLEEIRLQWALSNVEITTAKDLNGVVTMLSEVTGLPQHRTEREIRRVVKLFDEKVRRAVEEFKSMTA